MNAVEVNVLLTAAARVDARMKRANADDQADMATAWAELLVDVELEGALEAMREHYRVETRPLMPADLVAAAAVSSWDELPALPPAEAAADGRGLGPGGARRRMGIEVTRG